MRGAVDADAALIEAATGATGSAPWSRAQVLAELSLAASRAYVAEDADEGSPAGILVARLAADELEILQLHVAADRRRLGIATALLGHAVAQESGLDRVWIEVRADNEGARGFYEASGFEPAGTRSGYYRDGEAAIVMSRPRRLAPGGREGT